MRGLEADLACAIRAIVQNAAGRHFPLLLFVGFHASEVRQYNAVIVRQMQAEI